MSDRIAIADLEAAVAKAAVSIKGRHGPIIMGFIAPEGLDHAEAEKIAADVTHASGLKGTPTVTTAGAAPAAGAATERAHFVPPHRIIIGLIMEER